MLSWCPTALAAGVRALVDAESVEWDGGRYCTTSYWCACCGARWSEDNWPVVLLVGNENMPAARKASPGRRWRHHSTRPHWPDVDGVRAWYARLIEAPDERAG